MQESNSSNFNHLKIHSQFSICEGAIKIDDLKDITKDSKFKGRQQVAQSAVAGTQLCCALCVGSAVGPKARRGVLACVVQHGPARERKERF